MFLQAGDRFYYRGYEKSIYTVLQRINATSVEICWRGLNDGLTRSATIHSDSFLTSAANKSITVIPRDPKKTFRLLLLDSVLNYDALLRTHISDELLRAYIEELLYD